jgi:hypothetical protein
VSPTNEARLQVIALARATGDDSLDLEAVCLNIAAIAPDGHDVMDDNSGFTESWRITSRSPESGTPVAENETVTLNVSR